MDRRRSASNDGRPRTYPLAGRKSQVSVEQFAEPVDDEDSLAAFLDGLSDLLAARALRRLAHAVVEARLAGRPVLWACGGHVVKVGLSPVLIRLMQRGLVTGLVLNGSTAIHDWEIAAVGATSEDVEDGLSSGMFGMTEETGRELNAAARQAQASGEGFGAVLARRVAGSDLPHRDLSLLAATWNLGLPCTIHVAIGCDTVHQHPSADGAAIGAATFRDFRRLVDLVGTLTGGVWINCGSAVQLPEVFLKALSLARNTGHRVEAFTTANLDMQRGYRPDTNVLRRPHGRDGRGISLLGHHEINVPLLAAAIQIEQRRRTAGQVLEPDVPPPDA